MFQVRYTFKKTYVPIKTALILYPFLLQWCIFFFAFLCSALKDWEMTIIAVFLGQ